jgi:putative endonuclease
MRLETFLGYYVYLLTDEEKAEIQPGITGDINSRAIEGLRLGQRHRCRFIVYVEKHRDATGALQREKEIKGLSKRKKKLLVDSFNPGWKFLNEDILNASLAFEIK